MARTLAEVPTGTRLADYISLGVLAKTFPADRIHAALAATERTSRRQRELPAHVVVYYVIALALYMQVSHRAGGGGRGGERAGLPGPVAGRGGRPLQQVHDEVVRPIAVPATKGAWYRNWR